MTDQRLSPHFSLSELLVSETATEKGISEQFNPSPDIIANLIELCTNVMEPIRELIGQPINVSSGYRSPRLNSAVGGEPNSQHLCNGGCAAADIYCPSLDVTQLYERIKNSDIRIDELIIETNNHGAWWVHCSYDKSKAIQLGLCLKGVLQPQGGTVCQLDGHMAWVNNQA